MILLIILLLVVGELGSGTLRSRVRGEREGDGTRYICGPRGGYHRVCQQARQEVRGRHGERSVLSSGLDDRSGPAVPDFGAALDLCRDAGWHGLIVSLEEKDISMEVFRLYDK
jgi:hypothetical protein